MNIKFTFKGLDVQLPEQDAKIRLDEINYEVQDANVLEIAKASKEIATSFLEIIKASNETASTVSDYVPLPDIFPKEYKGLVQGATVWTSDNEKATLLDFNTKNDAVFLRFDLENGDYYTSMYNIEEVYETNPAEFPFENVNKEVEDDGINDEQLAQQ